MWESVTRDLQSFGDVLVRLVPYLLTALAVVVPARAGLFNIGGEGQTLLGAIGAFWIADLLGQNVPRVPTLLAMTVGAMLAGGLWAGIPALLRLLSGANETISTLLMNYLAVLFLGWLVFEPWKSSTSVGFPRTRAFDEIEQLPLVVGRAHIGIIVAIMTAFAVWATMRWTSWGFQLTVLGTNPEAARRAGFDTNRLTAFALIAGGGLAGLAGMLHVTGVEKQLRPDIMSGYGFTGLLAAWMVRHHPLKAITSSALLAAIAIGGNGLKIRAGLSGASVNILMALILLGVLSQQHVSRSSPDLANDRASGNES